VTDGAVALTGHTSTYAEKLAAERAARRVHGVKAVANDLKVHLAGTPRDDADIATAIAHIRLTSRRWSSMRWRPAVSRPAASRPGRRPV
jgi:BON domain